MKNKLILPMLAAIMVFTIALGASAFKADKNAKQKSVSTKYFKFKGTSASDYTNPLMWEVSETPYEECEGTITACTVSSTSLVDENDLTDFLINAGGTPRDPNTNYGSDYQIESERQAFE
ncbi:MAG: hypothetical protein GXC73_17415 [Chitinophagaceae bacterium]|nr:hypothetical protein [Chitinophagaceae bacterium]